TSSAAHAAATTPRTSRTTTDHFMTGKLLLLARSGGLRGEKAPPGSLSDRAAPGGARSRRDSRPLPHPHRAGDEESPGEDREAVGHRVPFAGGRHQPPRVPPAGLPENGMEQSEHAPRDVAERG